MVHSLLLCVHPQRNAGPRQPRQMKLEEMLTDCKAFGARVQENAVPALAGTSGTIWDTGSRSSCTAFTQVNSTPRDTIRIASWRVPATMNRTLKCNRETDITN